MITEIIKGDIAKQDTEAVVNDSNKELAWEDLTVNGAIQCGAGMELTNELELIHKTIGDLRTSDIVITDGYKLPYKKIIHTVGPVYPYNPNAILDLNRTYQNCFSAAYLLGIKSITFPAISTGVFQFPIVEATEICYFVYQQWQDQFDRLVFCCYTENDKQIYKKIFKI